ncbi:MAG: KH domain-containing protein [Candidatus Pacearchaeota archaeon]|nr:KH domain-containing protein [Candidatus Pacearchaeota archaeon]
MKKLISDKIIRIIKSKGILEKELNVTLEINGNEISISGKPEEEYIAERVIEALDFGFPFSAALEIKKEDILFEILNIKECTPKKNFERVRGRVIGKEGKALKTISSLSDCHIELSGNKVGIIGNCENIRNAEEACKLLIKGSKHANVYAYLEKHRVEPITDLGLKEVKKK